jgi:CDP-diacylglycerol--glycerol-3-phosphate 3-phosphatidyltransferase
MAKRLWQTVSIPTWITLVRLLGIPVLFYSFYPFNPVHRWWTVGLFLAIAATDWLDGYLARRLDQVTDLGKILDPLVDKLLVMAPLLLLLEVRRIPAWGVFLILARELGIAGWRVNQPKIHGANYWGKAKTVSQIGAISVLIAPLPSSWEALGLILFWLAVGLTVISGLIYLKQ